jgi:hypothetical protein
MWLGRQEQGPPLLREEIARQREAELERQVESERPAQEYRRAHPRRWWPFRRARRSG